MESERRLIVGKLDGKVAIVTGASRGIGKVVAQTFASEGAKVVCAARTVGEGEHFLGGSLSATVSEIQKAGGTALAVQTDVSDEESCSRLVEATKKAFGSVDVLVNDAVLSYFIPIKDYPIKKWVRAFAVNVHGPFMLSKMVLPDMMERRRGAIINISSGAAIGPGRGPYKKDQTEAGGTMYGATKAALERFTQGLAQEMYEYEITVAAVSPSLVVPTPGTVYHKLVTGFDDPKGEPPELMAKAILLLATEPLNKVSGRVTYSQLILKEFGWITDGRGRGIDSKGTGYSQI
ncbi:MAG: SDR family NAD(P)-dependent oxidoreductase [Candidatus Tectomicrobia bacterium]|uniref:SDR family NAD(P)-dependent oxidoreductase n=1 Tax=Tectimicrobiota bacterium TaxID=2528274 RepID=A0A933GKL2_UNCTE|nr:SDR family NAD(P)-dependent oxidoreductase [Candidatus Tectomicrobia bacterium]